MTKSIGGFSLLYPVTEALFPLKEYFKLPIVSSAKAFMLSNKQNVINNSFISFGFIVSQN